MFSPSIERALSLAVLANDELIQTGTRPSAFPVRPLHVALMLARWEQDEDVIVAGLARGLVTGAPAWKAERVEQQFGRHVAALVAELDGLPTLESLARSQDGLEAVARLSPEAATILAVEALHALHHLHAELREVRDLDHVGSRFQGGSAAVLGGANALAQALGGRVEPRVSRALSAVLRALAERARPASVGPRG